MKKIKTVISLALAVAMLTLIPGVNNLQASAEERTPVTYILKYMEDSGSWHFQATTTGTWNDKTYHRTLYYLSEMIQAGDHVIIDDSPHALELNIPIALASITFNHTHSANITVKSADNVYVLKDSVAIVNGYVFNAHVYDNGIANFNNNVANLFIEKGKNAKQNIAVVGTVDYVAIGNAEKITTQLYTIRKNTLRVKDGNMTTPVGNFSYTPPVHTLPL